MKKALFLKKSDSSEITLQAPAASLPKKFTVDPQTGQLHVKVEDLAKIWHGPSTDDEIQED